MESENDIEFDLAENFRGEGFVKLVNLSFPEPLRDLEPALIERLKGIFEGRGCHRFDASNVIPAFNNTGRQHVSGEVDLDKRFKIQYLYGQHRIEAAKAFFKDESWESKTWLVKFYSRGMFDTLLVSNVR